MNSAADCSGELPYDDVPMRRALLAISLALVTCVESAATRQADPWPALVARAHDVIDRLVSGEVEPLILTFNDKMKAALALGVTDPEAANKQWAEIDRAVMEKSPALPLFTPKHLDFVSKRLGNFQFNSQYYFMVTQAWVQ